MTTPPYIYQSTEKQGFTKYDIYYINQLDPELYRKLEKLQQLKHKNLLVLDCFFNSNSANKFTVSVEKYKETLFEYIDRLEGENKLQEKNSDIIK